MALNKLNFTNGGVAQKGDNALYNFREITADMHVHSVYSDGTMPVSEVIMHAKSRGVGLVCITDHDNMNGCAELLNGVKDTGILAVNGIEISAYEGATKVHVLGYNADVSSPAFKEYYKRAYDSSYERAEDVLKKLKAVGVSLTLSDVLRERKKDVSPIHAMYVARAGAKKGYALSPFAFYGKYLTVGCPAFSAVGRITPSEAVKVIKESGGIVSLAHPGRIELSQTEINDLIQNLINCGMDGIEAVYSGHTNVQTAYYKEMAQSKNLLITGGSDTHFAEGNRSIGTPRFIPSERLLHALKLI